MPIQVTCAQCGKTYQVPESRAGQRGKCTCGAELVVPHVSAPAPQQPPALFGQPAAAPFGQLPPAQEQPGIAYGPPPRPAGTTCRFCGTAMEPGANFCPRCGAGSRPSAAPAGYSYAGPVERPIGITILCVLDWVFYGLACLFAVLMLIGGIALLGGARPFDINPQYASIGGGVLMGGGVVVLGLSVVFIYLVKALWNGANWARILFTVMTGIGVFFQLLGLGSTMLTHASNPMMFPRPGFPGGGFGPGGFGAPSSAALFSNVLGAIVGLGINGLILWVLNNRQAKDFCSQ